MATELKPGGKPAPAWDPQDPGSVPSWNPLDPQASVEAFRRYAESRARWAIDWYQQRKRSKARLSRFLRLIAILGTGAGGLVPVLVSTGLFDRAGAGAVELQLHEAHVNQFGYLAIGLAALAMAFDRFFGSSSGWMRYITAAMELETQLEKFQFEWAKLVAALAGEPPSKTQIEDMLNRIAEFGDSVQAVIENETRQWVAEFKADLAELNSTTKAALQEIRTESATARKDLDAERASSRPGALEVTVGNAAETDAGWKVQLDDGDWQAATGMTSALMQVPPGIHAIRVEATMRGVAARATRVVTVPSNDVLRVTLTLEAV